jgi:predicted nucleic acid-binding protein
MAKFPLDTNHLSHALGMQSSVRERIGQARRRGDRFATCWPALCELEAGLVFLADDTRHRRMLTVLLRDVRIWPFHWQAARRHGILAKTTRSRGRILSTVDLMLAALAWEEDAILLTADLDFQPFPEIRTENWIAVL